MVTQNQGFFFLQNSEVWIRLIYRLHIMCLKPLRYLHRKCLLQTSQGKTRWKLVYKTLFPLFKILSRDKYTGSFRWISYLGSVLVCKKPSVLRAFARGDLGSSWEITWCTLRTTWEELSSLNNGVGGQIFFFLNRQRQRLWGKKSPNKGTSETVTFT